MTVTASIYIDRQDANDVGWAYRIPGGESGALDGDAADAVQSLADGEVGDLAALLTVLREALPESVDRVTIQYAEDAHPVSVDLYPQGR